MKKRTHRILRKPGSLLALT